MPDVSYKPDDMRSITPFLTVQDAALAKAWWTEVLGAKEIYTFPSPDGSFVIHGCMAVGDCNLFFSEPFPGQAFVQPERSHVGLYLYVPDVDAVLARALERGAVLDQPAFDAFWGERYARFIDPFGVVWALATRIEIVSPETMMERAKALFGG